MSSDRPSCLRRTRYAVAMEKLFVVGVLVACAMGVASCSSAAGGSVSVARDREILLVPPVEVGFVGWCMAIEPGGGCEQGISRPPIVAETWTSSGPPTVTLGYALTSAEVFSVSVAGSSIPTYANTALPDGLRAAAVELPGLDPEKQALPRFIPLNGKGDVIPSSTGDSRGTPTIPGNLALSVPTRALANPAHPTSGVCRIALRHLAGLRVGGATVITAARSYTGLIGQGFMSCAITSYNLDGWPIGATTLLSAAHPGMAPPPLPTMTALSGHPDVFQAPGPQGALLARRVSGAWIVVTKGKGLSQRETLLEHLSASVHL
jgi:hypothetical protein